MNINSIIACFLLFTSIQVYAQQQIESYEEEVNVVTNKGKLYGSLLLPKTDTLSPVILIISGSGPTDRNGNNPMMSNNSLKMFAEAMANENIVSLRYDKRGIGASQEAAIKEDSLRFENLVEDALSWLQYLKKSGYQHIYIAGHSQGSLVGMLAAQQFEVDGFISIAGAGQPVDVLIKKQIEGQPQMIKDGISSALTKLKKGELVENVDPMLYSLLRPSVQPFLISYMKYDPVKEIKKLYVPTLIIQGSTDIQVSIEEAELLHKHSNESTLAIIEGMNHIFKASEIEQTKNFATYNDPILPIMDELKKVTIEFIK